MAYYENIDLFVTSDRNHADVINEPLEKIIENIKDTRSLIGNVQTNVDDLEENLKNNYTATEQLNDLLATGIKGDNGKNLEFQWKDYELGVRQEGQDEYEFTYLRGEKGEAGDVSTEQLEQAIQEAKTDLENEITNIPKVTKTSELTNDSGFITVNDIPEVDLEPYALKTEIPTTLPASDVYAWAKASTKPTYSASEVGALASNGTAVNASKVANALTISLNGTSQGAYNGSAVKNINITASSVGALPNVGYGGVHELGQYLDLHKGGSTADYDSRIHVNASNQIVHVDANGTLAVNYEINNLKNTVVDGKTSVANAINGKLGTTLSNQTSFADMAYYINTIKPFSFENLYGIGGYTSTPSGVAITYVIFKVDSNTLASSSGNGHISIQFTNNAPNTYRVVTVRTYRNGTRNVSTGSIVNENLVGSITSDLRFPSMDSDVASMVCVAVYDKPIYDVKTVEYGNGYDLICIP